MIVVNFGGPRDLEEIRSFLTELLSDQDVVRTRWPRWMHRWLFSRVAKKRAVKIRVDYEKIGGGSPIYRDTEEIAAKLAARLSIPVLPFHRYLTSTHEAFFRELETWDREVIRVVPLFPQFSFATTGSIARLFSEKLSKKRLRSLRWVSSYPVDAGFIGCYARQIRECLNREGLAEGEVALLFSCHGLPRSFIDEGDVYASECEGSFEAIKALFPGAISCLAYQSKFGRGEWLTPSTEEMCQSVLAWNQRRKAVVVVPLSFTSDHIETLFEIEELYLPLLRANGILAYRCPALNRETDWIDALATISSSEMLCSTVDLIRK